MNEADQDRRMFCLACRRTLDNDDRKGGSHRDTVTGDHDLATDQVTLTHDQCDGGEVAFSRRSLA